MNPTSQFSENFLKFKDEKYATISVVSSQIKIHFILKTLLLFPIPTNTINYFPHKFVTHVIFFKCLQARVTFARYAPKEGSLFTRYF